MLFSETAVTWGPILVRDLPSVTLPPSERPAACSSWGHGLPNRSVSLATRRHEAIGRNRPGGRGTLSPPRHSRLRALSRTSASPPRTPLSFPHRSPTRSHFRSRSLAHRSRSRCSGRSRLRSRRSRSPLRRRIRCNRRCARRPNPRRRPTRRLPHRRSGKGDDTRHGPAVWQDDVPARQGLLQRELRNVHESPRNLRSARLRHARRAEQRHLRHEHLQRR
jgi:hypothetical protein